MFSKVPSGLVHPPGLGPLQIGVYEIAVIYGGKAFADRLVPLIRDADDKMLAKALDRATPTTISEALSPLTGPYTEKETDLE